MAWHDCPACCSRMEILIEDGDPDRQVESCPDPECPYHLRDAHKTAYVTGPRVVYSSRRGSSSEAARPHANIPPQTGVVFP